MSWFDRFRSQEDPRKRSTGTSYSTAGSIKPEPGQLLETGSSRGGLSREIVPELGNTRQQVLKYDEMANNDAAVDVSLRAAKMPIMDAMFFIEPCNDDEVNLDIAEFVHFNLMEGTSAPFLNIMEDILRMFEYGYSVIEKVYETREWVPKRDNRVGGANRKKYTMLKKLSARPTPTIKEIEYDDNGGPVQVTQFAVQADGKPKEVDMPIEKLIIFSFNRKGGNLEGKSLLRTSYKHWYFKDNLYKIDGIQKERHGMGFPVMDLPPGYNDKDAKFALELVREIRTNERAGAVLPPGFILRFVELPGQPVDVMRSIEHHNGMIMLNTMLQFLLLGIEGSGGGRATSGSHQDMFTKSLRYVGQLICDYMNLYQIPQLVAYNWDTDKFPRMVIKNIGETKDLQQWAAAIANLIARGAISLDLEFEQWVRAIIDAPQKRGGEQTLDQNRIAAGGQGTSEKKGDTAGETTGNTGADPTAADT